MLQINSRLVFYTIHLRVSHQCAHQTSGIEKGTIDYVNDNSSYSCSRPYAMYTVFINHTLRWLHSTELIRHTGIIQWVWFFAYHTVLSLSWENVADGKFAVMLCELNFSVQLQSLTQLKLLRVLLPAETRRCDASSSWLSISAGSSAAAMVRRHPAAQCQWSSHHTCKVNAPRIHGCAWH